MMNNEFPDNSSALFGREADLAYLAERTRQRGVTAVIGQPQMGKSWLLGETARRLAANGWPGARGGDLSLQGLPPLLGLAESKGESADMLPRAVQDLYTRWLAGSSFGQQGSMVIEQQKKDLVGRVGEAFGSLVEKVAGLHGKGAEIVGGLVKQTFDGLATANRTLVSGDGMVLPRLQIEDSQELLAVIYKVTSRPAVLIFDQWEKSSDLAKEAGILDSFLRHVDDWPPCHILVGTRGDEKPRIQVNQLAESYPGVAEVYTLGPMALAEPEPKAAMLAFLRGKVSATRAIAEGTLLDLIAGNPRVLTQWTSSYNAQRVQSLEGLAKIADDANAYRYPEFKELLKNLTDCERQLAIRIGLLPAAGSRDAWAALRPLVLGSCPASTLDRLLGSGVLEASSPPTYGHAKRADAAFGWLAANCHEEMGETGEQLVIRVAAFIPDTAAGVLPYANALLGIRAFASRLELSPLATALCESACSLMAGQDQDLDAGQLVEAVQAASAESRPLLAMGLNNTLVAALAGAPAQLDLLLDGLRALQQASPSDQFVRRQLARGLYNAFNAAHERKESVRQASLVGELTALATAYLPDAGVREVWASSLYNMLLYAKQDGSLETRDKLLIEIESLGTAYPADAFVRQQRSMALNAALVDAQQEQDWDRRDALLGKLRSLAAAQPGDSEVRRRFAEALANMILYTGEEKSLAPADVLRRDGWLTELRAMAATYPADAAVRGALGRALFETLNTATLAARISPLQVLQGLVHEYPADAVVREWLAKAWFNTFYEAKQQGVLELRDVLLDQLRMLAKAYPHDAAVRKQLAMGLANTFSDMKGEGNPERRAALGLELQALTAAHPEDPFVVSIGQKLPALPA